MKTHENQWKQLPWMPQAPNGNELWAIGYAGHRFCHPSGPQGRSRRNSTTILHGFSLRVFLVASSYSRYINSCQNIILTNRNTINKLSQTLKSQNQTNWLLRYAIRNQIVPRIQCRRPKQPNTHIGNKGISKNRGRRQRRSLYIRRTPAG